jgi:hypothetical protein
MGLRAIDEQNAVGLGGVPVHGELEVGITGARTASSEDHVNRPGPPPPGGHHDPITAGEVDPCRVERSRRGRVRWRGAASD